MLEIVVPASEGWDEQKEQFVQILKEQTIVLEHSLVSISKWESKWRKPFFSKKLKSDEEMLDYIRCMTITQNVKPEVYRCLSTDNLARINDYMDSPMTATWFNDEAGGGNNKAQMTSELMYYNMIAYGIPFECQKWHINRLITLMRICDIKNRKPEKSNTGDILRQNAALNAKNRKKYKSNG